VWGCVATAGTKIGDEGPGGRAADQLLPEALKKTKDLAPHPWDLFQAALARLKDKEAGQFAFTKARHGRYILSKKDDLEFVYDTRVGANVGADVSTQPTSSAQCGIKLVGDVSSFKARLSVLGIDLFGAPTVDLFGAPTVSFGPAKDITIFPRIDTSLSGDSLFHTPVLIGSSEFLRRDMTAFTSAQHSAAKHIVDAVLDHTRTATKSLTREPLP